MRLAYRPPVSASRVARAIAASVARHWEKMGDFGMIKSVMAVLSCVSMLTLAACQQSGSTTNETTNATTRTTSASSSAGTMHGTWKGDVSSAKFERKPEEHLLQKGRVAWNSCVLSVA